MLPKKCSMIETTKFDFVAQSLEFVKLKYVSHRYIFIYAQHLPLTLKISSNQGEVQKYATLHTGLHMAKACAQYLLRNRKIDSYLCAQNFEKFVKFN